MPDTTDVRLLNMEHAFYDMQARLARTEDSYALMSSRCQALTESLVRCHQVGTFLSGWKMRLIGDMLVDSLSVPFRAVCDSHGKLAVH